MLGNFDVFNPKGLIALEQRNLIVTAVLLMLIVAVPMLCLAFYFAWKYRSSNKAKYTPNWDQNKFLRFIGIFPFTMVLILAIITWKHTQALDPFKPLPSSNKPLTIQVIALQWKWLFIYPEQNIATVNFVQFPKNTPINFELTADAPMTSFWIPQLGGQMYAMNGMKTNLHLMANSLGEFQGLTAEINGSGFSDMKFIAKASSKDNFNEWVSTVRQSRQLLDLAEYNELAQPSQVPNQVFYATVAKNVFDKTLMKYMPH